jgi:sulfate adenylyltransferase subunit 2
MKTVPGRRSDIFRPRDKHGDWDFRDQPPELWDQFKTTFPPGTHIRIHPLLDWTEINIWEYIKHENIPSWIFIWTGGMAHGIEVWAARPVPCRSNPRRRRWMRLLSELRGSNVAERAGRAQDAGRGMEMLRKKGYM